MAPFQVPREAHERPIRATLKEKADASSDSEEPTEFGVIWERAQPHERREVVVWVSVTDLRQDVYSARDRKRSIFCASQEAYFKTHGPRNSRIPLHRQSREWR